MDNLWLTSLSSIGLCFILKYSSIFLPIRQFTSRWPFFDELFKCSMCLGVWCGVIISLLLNYKLSYMLVFATYSSFICYITDWLLDIIESKLQ